MEETINIPVEGKIEEKVEEKTEPRQKWNWGAFLMPIQFAIANGAHLGLLALLPCLNIFWSFVSGALGEKWAYEGGKFANVDEFNGAMKSWNRLGKVVAIICAAVIVLYVLLFAVALMIAGSFAEIFNN